MEYAIGVDLGGTQLRAALIDSTGHMQTNTRRPTQAMDGPEAVMERMVTMIRQVHAAMPADGKLLGVGVGSPGPLNPDTGIVFHMPNLPGWDNVPMRDILQQKTGFPVRIGNDTNVAVMGEWHFGGGVGLNNVIYVTVSTGIGGGVIMDNRLLLGHEGAGTEVGHMIIDWERHLTWELLASGTALAATGAEAMRANPDTTLHRRATPETVRAADIAQAASEGDELAVRLMQREGEILGVGFVNLLHLYSPQRIIVGGSVVLENPYLLDIATAIVKKHVIADVYRQAEIRVTELGDQVVVLGAAALLFA